MNLNNYKKYLSAFGAIFSLLILFAPSSTFAAVSITTATGGTNISADKAANATSPAYTTLGNIVITENNNNDISSNGTFTVAPPSGWAFNTTGVTTSVTGGLTVAVTSQTASLLTLTISNRNNGSIQSFTIIGLQVRATNGASLPSSGNITRAGGTANVSGITNGSTNLGSLSQVVGVASKLKVGTQPSSTATAGIAFLTQPAINITDQFYNTRSTANGGADNSTVVTAARSTGTATLQGTLTSTASNGLATFSNLSYQKAETINLNFSSGSLTATTSNNIVVSAGSINSVVVSPTTTQSVSSFGTIQFSAQGFDSYNNALTGLTFTWAVVPGTGTGSVDSSGLFTAGNAGTVTVTATNGGKTGSSNTITITKINQSPLTAIATPSSLTYGSTSALTTSGGSGSGAVTFSAGASTGCSISGGTTLNVTDASGNCSVTATKAADATYNATTSAAITVTLSKANQAITFNALVDKQLGAADFVVSATANSGLTVAFTSQTPAVCTVSTATVHLVTTGTCTIRATQTGNTNYNAATPVDQSFTVTKQDQVTLVAIATPSSLTYGSTSALTTSGGSGSGAVTFSAGASTGCSITSSTLSVTDASGSCSVTATKAADATYNATTSAAITVTLVPKNITVTADAKEKEFGASDPVFTYTSSDLAAVFAGTLSRVSGEALGAYAITIGNLSAGSNYIISFVSANLTIINSTPIITSISPTNKFIGDAQFTLTVNGQNFNNSSVVRVNGGDRVTVYSSSTLISATIPASDLLASTTLAITAFNATTSNTQYLYVSLVIIVPTKFVITDATDGTIDLASMVTIKAFNASDELADTYQQDVTLVTSGGATGGGLINIVNGIGTTTISDNTVESVHLSLQDTESTNLNVSSSRDISFGPGSTASLSLSAGSSTQMVAGERLPLLVSRQDRLSNNVILGSETFYLYSNSVSPAKKFYDASTGGNIVSSILIPNNSSSATIWYYDEKVGAPTITVSDNSTSPDGSGGVADDTTDITVTSAPALTLSLNNPGDLVAGDRLSYEVSRQDQFGNPSDNGSLTVYLYDSSSFPSTVFYDSASGGNVINSLAMSPGSATSSFWLYGEKAENFSVTVSDNSTAPDGATGVNDASDNVTVNAGPVSTLTLNNPGDVMVGTRAGYTVSRLDFFGNPVTAGETIVYLFQNDTVGTSTEFFDAADGGNSITSLSIADTFSASNFWLYPSGVTSYNVTVSETTPANGSTGITDAVDPINISSVPIVPTRIVILDTTPTVVGETASIIVQVQDGAGNTDTSFAGSVTLHTSGSATPGGIVSISGGVGTINIIDTKAETVNLTLEDTGGTSLDVSSTKTISFLPGPTKQFIMTGNTTSLAGERVNYTINRKDQYNNSVTSGSDMVYLYSNALPGTANFYNVASGGSQILSTSILNGGASTNVYFAGTMAGTIVAQASDNASAPDGGDGIVDGTSTLAVSPAATARLSLNDPGDMFNGTRLGYTATRYDAYNNLVTAGGANYYLYSNANSTSTAFYSSASGGSPITNLSFSDTQSTAGFWYYEMKNGIWTVYLSDNSSNPDGTNGIVDGEDGVIVSAIPIVATRLIIVVPDTSVMVNTPTTVAIRAVNNDGDIDTSFNGAVTLNVSGSAIGGGLVTLVNGVGTKVINDTAEETVNLSLQDTEGTGLNVSDTQAIAFSRTAAVPVGGGGGGGVIAPVVSFSGLAFPNASVEIMAIQDGQVPVGNLGSGGTGGNFSARYTGKLPASIKSFALVVYDKEKNIAQTKIFKLGVNDQLFKTLLMSPTVDLKQDSVTLGTFEGITGSAMPGYKVELMIDGVKAPESATALANGDYNLNFNTYRLGLGDHTLKVRQVSNQGTASDYSIEKTFTVIKSFIPKADLNKDAKVDIADWGIFMSRYRLLNDKNRLDLDLNSDGKVDVQDLNLLMQAIKK